MRKELIAQCLIVFIDKLCHTLEGWHNYDT